MTLCAGDGGQLPAERGIHLKEKKINQGGKHNFSKSLGMEGALPRFLEEFQEGAAELVICNSLKTITSAKKQMWPIAYLT